MAKEGRGAGRALALVRIRRGRAGTTGEHWLSLRLLFRAPWYVLVDQLQQVRRRYYRLFGEEGEPRYLMLPPPS